MGITLRFISLLLPIVGAALAFVIMAEPSAAPQTRVAIEPPPKIITTPEERAFEQELEEIGASLDGVVGIAVVDVDAERAYEFNGDALLPQQSVTKLWVALTALAQVDTGELSLGEQVTIGREDLTVFYQPIRNIVRSRGSFSTDYRDLMERALARSDNSANDRLLRRVGGPQVVQDWIDAHGLDGVRFGTDERTKQSAIAGLEWRQSFSFGSRFFDARGNVPREQRREAFENYLAGPIDGATPVGIARALAALARGELLSDRSTRLIRDILATTRSGPRRLKAGAPDDWRVEHKTGTGQFFDGEQSGYNDVGLVTAPDGSEYAIAVMVGRTREPTPARMEMMQAVTRATAEFHRKRSSQRIASDAGDESNDTSA